MKEEPIAVSRWFTEDITLQLREAGFQPSETNIQRVKDQFNARRFLEMLAQVGNEVLHDTICTMDDLDPVIRCPQCDEVIEKQGEAFCSDACKWEYEGEGEEEIEQA